MKALMYRFIDISFNQENVMKFSSINYFLNTKNQCRK